MNRNLIGQSWAVRWEIDPSASRAEFSFGHELRPRRALIVQGGRVVAEIKTDRDAKDVAQLIAQAPALARAIVDATARLERASHPNAKALREMLENALRGPEEWQG